jgi:hypothetical protein
MIFQKRTPKKIYFLVFIFLLCNTLSSALNPPGNRFNNIKYPDCFVMPNSAYGHTGARSVSLSVAISAAPMQKFEPICG